MAIPQNFIQDLLARTDVVEVVGRHVELKKAGANYAGLCPFHDEKTPSFTVSPAKQFYHCFGCGQNGNAIGFLMAHTGVGFVEAVHELAHAQGLSVPEDERSPAERARASQQAQQRASLSDVLERAAQAWAEQLAPPCPAVDYLKQRGVRPAVARRFGLGWAAPGWRGLASVFPDYTDPMLVESGLVITSEDEEDKRYDRFRARLMFPIRNVRGEVIGFGGRVLGDEKPKYLNSPETPVFHKGRELYGLHEARQAIRQHGCALVVEGYMDVVALAQHGLDNAVATLGTACTPEHLQLLFRFTDRVVFGFDGDAAGRRAARKALDAALPLATDLRSVRFLFLPPEHDPDSFVRSKGRSGFEQAMAEATPLSTFLLDEAAQDCDLDTPEGRARFAAQAQPLWQALPAGVLAHQLLDSIASQAQLSVPQLQQVWHSRQPRGTPSPVAGAPDRGPAPNPTQTLGLRASSRKGRHRPMGRASRALQIVLTAPHTWLDLSAGDQQLLCELPTPHGELFAWIDSQLHEHGPQPWSALRQHLHGHPHEDAVLHIIGQLREDIASDPGELHTILRLERPVHLQQRMDAALAAGDLGLYQRLLPELAAAKAELAAPDNRPT